MNPDLTISVLHYNQVTLTHDCVASVEVQNVPCSTEKHIIDNGSEYALKDVPYPGWTILRYPTNRGHISGQNRCFQRARGSWVLFIANDVRLLPDCLATLWSSKDPHGVIQPVLYTLAGTIDNGGLSWRWPGYGLSKRGHWETPPDAFAASCYLMPRSLWERLHGFDETLRTSHEDVEFSLRASQMGHLIRVAPRARAIHLGNATLRDQRSHTRRNFHLDRRAVIQKHYHGLDRLLRLVAVGVLDTIPRL